MDVKTEQYLTEEATRIGYLGTNNSWYSLSEILKKKGIEQEPKKIDIYQGYMNSSDIEIYEYIVNETNKYCAELGYQTDIDDYNIETIIFNKKPSLDNVITARMIDDIKFQIKFNKRKEEFTCWECGLTSHWTDIPGTFKEKVNYWEDGYCGC